MRKEYKRLAAKLLGMAADDFGNRCCNDFDLTGYVDPPVALELAREMHAWNGDPECAPTNERDAMWTADFFVMGYLAHLLEEESK